MSDRFPMFLHHKNMNASHNELLTWTYGDAWFTINTFLHYIRCSFGHKRKITDAYHEVQEGSPPRCLCSLKCVSHYSQWFCGHAQITAVHLLRLTHVCNNAIVFAWEYVLRYSRCCFQSDSKRTDAEYEVRKGSPSRSLY